MSTESSTTGTLFHDIAGRDAVVRFDAGDVTSDGGVVLLERADRRIDLTRRFAPCFRDHRNPERVEHTVRQLVTQRVFGLCLGYEDVSDHDLIGKDPLLAAACGRGQGSLAGKSTLSRLEMTKRGATSAALHEKSKKAERVFRDFDWTTLDTCSHERRVVAKAEHLVGGKQNPRFVVTNLSRNSWSARRLYEDLYCARGEAENRIKEQQLGLFGTRLSTPTLQGNAVRTALSAMAYVLTCALRRLGLAGTEMERAQADTIRLRLLKVGALVRVTTRKIWISMSSSWPWKESFEACARRLLAPAAVT
ncbi:MAG: hypothetical protein HMLKMBBP_01238 [Planctomycetes bacterium]|nr:hypothetical protein [Planctomycetota bacterium]